MTLDELNQFELSKVSESLLQCCGSRRWVERMALARPYPSIDALLSRASIEWNALSREDWLEAFSHHPRIGDRSGPAHTRAEQAGTAGASPDIRRELAELNAAYDQKFGHVFLICATGKSAEEMLRSLRLRIQNSSEKELEIAAAEQSKITHLRLRKLLEQKS